MSRFSRIIADGLTTQHPALERALRAEMTRVRRLSLDENVLWLCQFRDRRLDEAVAALAQGNVIPMAESLTHLRDF